MDQDIKKKIKEIIGEIQCPHPRELCCLETGFDRTCKKKDVGMEEHFECLEDEALCPFLVHFGRRRYCNCPLRVYICKKLGE